MTPLRSYNTPAGSATLYDFRDLDEKLRFMREMINTGRENPVIRKAAVQIIMDSGCPRGDKKEQALCIGQWVQDNIYYVHEFPERLTHATRTLEQKAGDCDDMTILIGSLCENIGIPVLQVCMKINGIWKHIFPAAIMEGKKYRSLLPLDATMKMPVKSVYNPIQWANDRGKTVMIKLA